jgi:hypothetical protein
MSKLPLIAAGTILLPQMLIVFFDLVSKMFSRVVVANWLKAPNDETTKMSDSTLIWNPSRLDFK